MPFPPVRHLGRGKAKYSVYAGRGRTACLSARLRGHRPRSVPAAWPPERAPPVPSGHNFRAASSPASYRRFYLKSTKKSSPWLSLGKDVSPLYEPAQGSVCSSSTGNSPLFAGGNSPA